jgi:hypothetical protein
LFLLGLHLPHTFVHGFVLLGLSFLQGVKQVLDHEPFASGSEELGKRFGADMSLLTTVDRANETDNGLLFSREKHQLGDHAIFRGRNKSEQVNRVLTFVGQSLKGPSGSVQLLKFSETAQNVGHDKKISAAGRRGGRLIGAGLWRPTGKDGHERA